MRNCQRCRPCGCGQKPGWNQGGGCGNVETIVEPTVHCRSEMHHHKRVRHIVPVVFHQTHHHHRHHEYEIQRRHTQDHNHHEHGRRNEDWCAAAGGGCGGGQGHGGQGHGGGGCGGERPTPRFENDFEGGFDNQETDCGCVM